MARQHTRFDFLEDGTRRDQSKVDFVRTRAIADLDVAPRLSSMPMSSSTTLSPKPTM